MTSDTIKDDHFFYVALETFASLGWRDSAVTATCLRAGITSSQFYAAYESIDVLFEDLYQREARARISKVRDALVPNDARLRPDNLVAAVHAVSSALLLASDDRRWWILTTEYMARAARHPEAAATYVRVHRRANVQMALLVRESLASMGLPAAGADEIVERATAWHRAAVANSLIDPDVLFAVELDRLLMAAVTTSLPGDAPHVPAPLPQE